MCNRYDTYFSKVFKIYTQLWKFQQENRQKLVEAGLKRWEIGDIASRIGQLYFGQYMRTSEASYLSESYIFYEAILTREYYKDGMFQDVNIARKQLRFFARFLTVCLVLSRREMVYQLVNHLKMLLDDCKRTFQVTVLYFLVFVYLYIYMKFSQFCSSPIIFFIISVYIWYLVFNLLIFTFYVGPFFSFGGAGIWWFVRLSSYSLHPV